MIGRVCIALTAVLLGGSALAAQQVKAAPDAPLTVTLGPLGTGKIMQATQVGSIGLLHSELSHVVRTSPEALRHARIFERERTIGRPLILLGGAAVAAGLASWGSSGALGMRGWEVASLAGGGVALALGSWRLDASHRALAATVAAFNQRR